MVDPRSCTFDVEVRTGTGSDIATVDALAQLALAGRRLGLQLRLTQAPAALLELVTFAGLTETLGLQAQRQSEQREQPLGVEEEGQLGDPAR
jgi:hypothetical protein